MAMKSVCVAACLLLSLQMVWAHSAELKECLDQHKSTGDDVKKFLEDKTASNDLKCFMKCMMMQFGGLKEDGTFDIKNMKPDESHEKFDDDIIAATESCISFDKTDDLCELAYLHNRCMLEKAPEKWTKIVEEHTEGM